MHFYAWIAEGAYSTADIANELPSKSRQATIIKYLQIKISINHKILQKFWFKKFGKLR